MREKSREERFDELYQIVLVVVALSFDILWDLGRLPIAEIAVFIFALSMWAIGNLKGGTWEYPLKLGSFNISIILLTNFYIIAVMGDLILLAFMQRIVATVVLPLVCATITASLAAYLKETLDKQMTLGVLVGGTLGYMMSMSMIFIFI